MVEAGLRPVESRRRVGNRRSRSPADDRAPRLSALHRRQALTKLDDDLPDASKRLDCDVVNDSQLRLVIQTFHDSLPQIIPGRTEALKTLIFAKTVVHADQVVESVLAPDVGPCDRRQPVYDVAASP